MTDSSSHNPSPSVTPLGKDERRVLGVLVEKAKTTPDNYPLSIASIVAGANQKSNRAPIMNLDDDDVQIALDKLKTVGAAREIQGGSRVAKFRHVFYEWLGVDAAEASVMTELLLRGPQTAGELRARASRMHDFPELENVTAVIASLTSKGLVQALTPPGRGQTFAHKLYPPDEQRYLAAKVVTASNDDATDDLPPPARMDSSKTESRLLAVEAKLEELQAKLDELEARLPVQAD